MVCCLDTAASAQLRLTYLLAQCLRLGSAMDTSSRFRFTMTSAVSMARSGAVQLMLWPEGFPAKTSAAQAKAQGLSKARSRACGSRCLEWSASASQLTSSLRTRRCSVHGDSTLSSKDLPASGLMRRGTLYPQPTSVRHISESGCGYLLPTPTVQDASNNGGPSQLRRNSLPLNVVAKFPTPTARNCVSNCPSELQRNEPSLSVQVAGVGGKLNPRWVEWLMGWPIGWVSLDALATDRFQLWRQQRFDSFGTD